MKPPKREPPRQLLIQLQENPPRTIPCYYCGQTITLTRAERALHPHDAGPALHRHKCPRRPAPKNRNTRTTTSD